MMWDQAGASFPALIYTAVQVQQKHAMKTMTTADRAADALRPVVTMHGKKHAFVVGPKTARQHTSV